MTYAKLPLPCVDYPFGFEDANQLVANNDAIKDLLEDEHSIDAPTIPKSLPAAGEHKGRRFARSLLKVSLQTINGQRAVVTETTGPVIASVLSPSTGLYTVVVQHLADWRALSCGFQTSAATRLVSMKWTQTLSAQGFPDTLIVKLASAGVLADFPFSLLIWEP